MDKWKPDHLRAMMLGGNQRAKEFFKQHGWDDTTVQDFEAKYHSRAAKLYHKTLYKEVAAKSDKPQLASPKAFEDVKVPMVAEMVAEPIAQPEVLQPKRTITPPNQPTGELGGVELLMGGLSVSNGSNSTSAPVVRPKKSGGLGAKRLGAPVAGTAVKDDDLDLEKAKQEIEKQKEAAKAALEVSVPVSRYGNTAKTDNSDDFFSMMSTGPSKSTSSSTYSSGKPAVDYNAPVPSGTAQERFKNAKAISSDQFFGRDKNDEDQGMKQAQLSKFSGASSISSDAYFNKEPASSSSNSGAGGSHAVDFFAELTRQVKNDVSTLAQQAKESLAKYNSQYRG